MLKRRAGRRGRMGKTGLRIGMGGGEVENPKVGSCRMSHLCCTIFIRMPVTVRETKWNQMRRHGLATPSVSQKEIRTIEYFKKEKASKTARI